MKIIPFLLVCFHHAFWAIVNSGFRILCKSKFQRNQILTVKPEAAFADAELKSANRKLQSRFSPVVRAIAEGRACAQEIDRCLMGCTNVNQ